MPNTPHAPTSNPAVQVTHPQQPPVTNYDLAAHFLLSGQTKDPMAIQRSLNGLVQAYGPEAVGAALHHIAHMSAEFQAYVHACLATFNGRAIQPPHPSIQAPNPYPQPNYAGAAQVVRAYQQSATAFMERPTAIPSADTTNV